MATTKKKTASTKIANSTAQLHEEFDKNKDSRTPKLKPGSQLLGKQKDGTARTLISAPILTNRPINVYIERVVNHTDGSVGLWIWYTTEQSKMMGKVRLVEMNNSTLEEIYTGDEWSIEYTKANAAKIAAESFGKTNFIYKEMKTKTSIPREKFLDYKV